LTKKIAQRIADEVMASLGYNINVMNDKGIIIGSGSASRIGTFHEAAMNVIRDREIHEVCAADVETLQGVRPGINMPIMSGDKVVGVIGITGEPAEVRYVARLVKMAAELIIEQEETVFRFYMRRNNKDAFITSLLNGTALGHSEDLKGWAESLGYDLALPRVACLIEFADKAPAQTPWKQEEQLNRIKACSLHLRQDISVMLSSHLLVFKSLTDTSPWGIEEQLTQYADCICDEADLDGRCAVRFFVGGYHEGVPGYSISYSDAYRLYKGLGAQGGRVNFTHRNLVHNIFDRMRGDLHKETLQPYVDRIKAEFGERAEDAVRTVQILINNGFLYEKAAEALFVHKNTVFFRKKKLEECLGLDPKTNSNDLLLMLLVICQFYANAGAGGKEH
jgi:carbohydrate diacid regulator